MSPEGTTISRERRAGVLFMGATIAILALIAIILATSRAAAFHYTVVFGKGKLLKVGDRVQLNGVDIGEVDRVELSRSGETVSVRIEIASEHREKVRTRSTARIHDVTLVNVSGQKIVEIVNSPVPSDPMPEGAVIEGKDSLLALQMWKMAEKMGEDVQGAAKVLGEGAKGAAESAREFARSEEFKAAMKKLIDFLAEAGEKGAEGIVALLEQWESIQQEIVPLLERLKEEGKVAIVEQFKRLMEEIQRQLGEFEQLKREKPETESLEV